MTLRLNTLRPRVDDSEGRVYVDWSLVRGNLLRGWITFGDSVFINRPVAKRVFWKFFLCSVIAPGVQDRGSSLIILARPCPEGRSHEAVTFAWFGRVGGSGLLEMTRIPPSDSLTDEKSLTTIIVHYFFFLFLFFVSIQALTHNGGQLLHLQ